MMSKGKGGKGMGGKNNWDSTGGKGDIGKAFAPY
eukprot:CAMPEP_0180648616 /NCGR_PEP_ID=MMETSP1037_2-20121125/51076_1 /TAXON_ID=632150 /ORGANISM="Azadinium spinosum, Strain 3D9" /LENGTH=33 /DNA_ID= /DNA_START= /DNA_END= /DNA_ORIENTATION=